MPAAPGDGEIRYCSPDHVRATLAETPYVSAREVLVGALVGHEDLFDRRLLRDDPLPGIGDPPGPLTPNAEEHRVRGVGDADHDTAFTVDRVPGVRVGVIVGSKDA